MQNTRYTCQILMKLKFSGQSLKKLNILKFHDSASSGSIFIPLGQPNRRTDMTKLIVALRNFTNAPKNHIKQPVCPGQDSEKVPSKKIRQKHYCLNQCDRLYKV